MEKSFQKQDMQKMGSSPNGYKSHFVKVTLFRQSGKKDLPIETTLDETGVELYLIPNNQREDKVVAYQIGNGPVTYLDIL